VKTSNFSPSSCIYEYTGGTLSRTADSYKRNVLEGMTHFVSYKVPQCSSVKYYSSIPMNNQRPSFHIVKTIKCEYNTKFKHVI